SARTRFALTRSKLRLASPHDGPAGVSLVLARYADEAEAIRRARHQWTELRRTQLTPSAISDAQESRPANSGRNPRKMSVINGADDQARRETCHRNTLTSSSTRAAVGRRRTGSRCSTRPTKA